MSPTRKAQWQIHFCVLLWGFTAILGKLISLPALALVWWRMLLVTVALLLVPRVWRGMCALPARLLAIVLAVLLLDEQREFPGQKTTRRPKLRLRPGNGTRSLTTEVANRASLSVKLFPCTKASQLPCTLSRKVASPSKPRKVASACVQIRIGKSASGSVRPVSER